MFMLVGEEKVTQLKCFSLKSKNLHAEKYWIKWEKCILVLNSGLTKFPIMTQENHSSRQEDETKNLKKKVENLEKILELQRKTIEHDKRFGKYEMM